MQRTLLASLCLAAVLAAGPSFADTTPEEAIAAYIEGVADRDLEAVIAATTVDNKSKLFDFVASVDRLKALIPTRALMPATDPLFVKMNKAGLTASVAGQVQYLAYGLMTTTNISESTKMDGAGAADLVSTFRADRLGSLELVKVGIPKPELMNSATYQFNANQIAKVAGADASTERLALLSFEGLPFVVGFNLLKYDDEWQVDDLSSTLSGLSFRQSKRVTPDEFENMLK